MKAENKTHPVHPEFKDTFSEAAFPLPGIFSSVSGTFAVSEITETASHYDLLLHRPPANGVDWHVAHRHLVFGTQRTVTFYLPADADVNALVVTHGEASVRISVGKSG